MAATKRAAKKSTGQRSLGVSSDSAATPADAIDAQLAKYRSMRNFTVTEEPAGAAKKEAPQALPFCIQKHAASHLHYDFRLGWAGVLKSWAVAKGPSYFPGDKRLAVQVEDHPMEYGGFEGIIPAGQYGGGTVMVWDQGTWQPQPGHEDVDAGLRAGSLKFIMQGEKIKGKWTLVRMGGKAATERKPNWLLIKEHDDFERGKDAPCVTEAEQQSIVTGRTMEQIAGSEDHVWNSKETAGTGQAWYRKAEASGKAVDARGSRSAASAKQQQDSAKAKAPAKRGAGDTREMEEALALLPKEAQASFYKPQLALEATEPPANEGWLHELKLDGYRIQARKAKGDVQLLTRSGLDWTHRVPAVAQAVAQLAPKTITLDGEVVVLASDGTTNFADLQASFQEGAQNALTYFCFDLLHLEGRDPRGLPLRQRKELLAKVLTTGEGDQVRLSEHIEGEGEAMFHKACELHAEGIVSKRAEAPYKSGRGSDWLKSKCLREQEFVIGGYTESSNGADKVGSLLLGYYRGETLVYAGRTGTGFTQTMRRSLMEVLRSKIVPKPAYPRLPTEARQGAVWVRPELVAQVRFATWTADNLVRQAAFLGLREDKSAREVQREEPTVAPKPKQGRTEKKKADAPREASRSSSASAKLTVKPQAAADRAKLPIRLTHPQKVLDAKSGVTKQMLAEYLWAVADRMLPHIAGRPLSLVRCPEGSAKPCFYQKHINHLLPEGVGSVDVPDKKGVIEPYITLESREALAGLAQMGVLEVHPWGSRNDDLEHADRMIFDLDPDESLRWSEVTEAAAEVRRRLKSRGIESFLKTTGGKGLHVVAPIVPELDWPGVKQWAHAFVLEMERASPTRYLTKMTKAARTGKIYLDYLRNERGATAVAPYSSRARSGLGVSMPLAWSELKQTQRPLFTVASFPEWKDRLKKDPWAKFGTSRAKLIAPR